jgi:hypothetical protein
VTRIAAARGLPVERVGALTLENTRRFFGWPT